MKASEQGVGPGAPQRYQVTPRTLIFLYSRSPESGKREVLLLRGAPDKRLWANKYNGIGGHVEAGEDVLSAALRELDEEAGVTGVDLTLRGVINIAVHLDPPAPTGVMVFVFCADVTDRSFTAGAEGNLAWIPVDELPNYPLVDDLFTLLPLLEKSGDVIFGHYAPRADGAMEMIFKRSRNQG